MNKMLAKISNATLEIKERGILNFWIYVDYEDFGSQGVGGICLDQWSEEHGSRLGTAYGCEMIRQLLLCLDVNDFSEMKGKMCWVYGEGEGLGFTPKGIGRLNVDKGNSDVKKVIFSEVLEMFAQEK